MAYSRYPNFSKYPRYQNYPSNNGNNNGNYNNNNNRNNFNQPEMPRNQNAEQAVLGSIFLDSSSLAKATQYLRPRDFYYRQDQIIYYAMLVLSDHNTGIDEVTIDDFLKNKHLLQASGGKKYIYELTQSVPSATNIDYYARIVKNKASSRKLIKVSTNILKQSYSQKNNINDVINQAESGILDVSQGTTASGLKPISNVLGNVLNNYNRASENKSRITGISTGFPSVDKVTLGLHKDELDVVAARPAMGKTTFALNVAENVAEKTHKSVAFFSAEMSADSICERMICAGAHIDSRKFRSGDIDAKGMRSAISAMGALSNTDIYIDDTPGISISALMARARQLAKQSGNLGLVVVDYLQLISGNKRDGREQEVSGVSRQLKNLARDLHVPVLALAQLSRSVEQRDNKRPMLSDLRESGAIEQDADVVAFLYRKDYYEQKKQKIKPKDKDDKKKAKEKIQKQKALREKIGDPSDTEFIVEKNRSGPKSTIHLMFLKAFNRFSSIIPQKNKDKTAV